MNPDILLFIIRLIAGGIVAFLAILLMSKTRDAGCLFMTGGFLFSYAALVFDLLVDLGVVTHTAFSIFGIPLSALISALLPSVCFIVALILMFIKQD